MAIVRIDAHQHFWQPLRGDYNWMPKDDPILARKYGPRDLAPILNAQGIDGTILVQAAATIHETEYLLGLADSCDSVKGVVGWIDFENPQDLHHLSRLARHPKFLGVRPMIQDIPDDDWMLRPDVQWGFQAVIDLDLTFDALGFPRHLANFLTLFTRYPDMRVVIDHCMKPQIRDVASNPQAFQSWADGMARLADQTRAYCKLSGLVTEAGDPWSVDDLRPYCQHVLKMFGPDRVMWGSDWPVCLLKTSYATWCETAQTLTAGLEAPEKQQVFGGAAARFFRLSD